MFMEWQDRLVVIKTDGASKGNPGPAGIGYHLDVGGVTIEECCDYIGEATNNEAEYLAVLNALENALELKFKQVLLQTDSNLIVQQLLGNWKVKSEQIQPLFNKVKKLSLQFKAFEVEHIRRELNKKADKLANDGVKKGTGVGASPRILEMPFGKYKGCPFHEIPSGYLKWLYTEADLSENLYAVVKIELQKRNFL